ncbi:hypothetical protein GCM10027429_07740 [Marivirga atlantica]|jgi:hypothetical protein|uniref:Sulfotransferase n=1 Tax=Marivirga atlantica TaxID=1548457 RepID=A0A937AD65_9BACT|nr:sulfotransferase [Marivirga atlantica]MBL0764384.1 sulfotransferase [Marivirga atlantica]
MGVGKTLRLLKSTVGVRKNHYFLFLFISLNKKLVRLGLNQRQFTPTNPIFLIGHLRSGTTFLHRLLSKSTSLYAMDLETMIFGSGPYHQFIKSIAGKKLKNISLDKVYDPKIHKTAFELPESDDIALYFQEFRGLLYWIYFLAWSNFSSTSELRESILSTVNDKKLITKQKKIYASKIKDTQRFISKSFFGIFHIEDSLKMYPDAKFIILFRDPKEVIPSTLSLEINIQRTLNDFDNQPKALQERYIKNLYQEVLLYFEKLYKVYHIEHPNLFKLNYDLLISNFEEVMHELSDFLALKDDTGLLKAIESQRKKQKQYQSAHKYSLEEFGISEAQIEQDFHFYYTLLKN